MGTERSYHPLMRLVLASASPRRAELLQAAGYEFVIMPVDVDEAPKAGETPVDYVRRLAEAKAQACAANVPTAMSDGLVLAADTTVVVDGRILGKPGDERDARRMLGRLSGRTHQVMTG